MIVGIGSDIININRIKKTINKFGNKFINKCFTKNEILISEKRLNKFSSYAKRFAAKEACSKALGTGFSKGIFWKDIGVINKKSGKPEIILTGGAKKKLNNIIPKNKIPKIDITITDENNLAQALVIISHN